MEIWLDTLNQQLITDAVNRGVLHGVTTNPTIVGKSQKTLDDVVEMLLDAQDGPIAVQVVADNPEEMIRQAEILTSHSPRVIVKVPVSNQGLLAIHTLTSKRIPVMATAVFDPLQALLALKAGAHYIAVYTGRIEERGVNPKATLSVIQQMIDNCASDTKIIAAGVKSKDFILFCIEQHIAAITLNDTVYKDLILDHPGTTDAIEKFDHDWAQAKGSF